jgi:transposase
MRTKPYSTTDLSDEQWTILEPLLPARLPDGRPREVNLREVLNAIFYKLKHAVVWADLPRDLPASGTVFDYYAAWSRSGLWERFNDALVGRCRQQLGREAAPSIAVLDSQSVANASEGALGGYDAAKHVDGIKRHILVDTNGFVLAAKVTAASVPEREGARALFGKLAQKKRRPSG